MSSTIDRQIAGYLDPKQFALFSGYCAREEMGKSEAVKTIVKAFFNSMPIEKQQEYLRAAGAIKEVKEPKTSWPT